MFESSISYLPLPNGIIDGVSREVYLINDQQFARDWINMRLRKPLGLRRIFFELKQKGISTDVMTRELSFARGNINEEEIISGLAAQRALKYQGVDERTKKRRVFEYLIRRGFTPEAVTKIVEGI